MKKYLKYLIELVVIVMGITLSFMVDEWREERQDREETVKVLKMLRSDIVSDTVQYFRINNGFEYMINGYKRQANFTELPTSIIDTLLNYYSYSLWLFPENTNTTGIKAFENLKNRTINNEEIITVLGEYYGQQNLDNSDELISLTRNANYDLIENVFVLLNFTRGGFNEKWGEKYDSGKGFIELIHWSLADSSQYNINQSILLMEELKWVLISKEYKNLLYRKQMFEFGIKVRNNNKIYNGNRLINLIDEELQE